MQIKVHRPKNANFGQKKDEQRKTLRMTLKEYLQSTNLKRRINSRSKSKSKKNSTGQGEDQNYLEPPFSHELIQYFKLNQQWKAKQTFQFWISNLKQLTREYIKKDTEYIEVNRLIQKIAEFVKNQIQIIKKDNLLLESYLVSEASYWPAEGSTYNQESNHDKLSNYLKVLINSKGESCESPNKSQQMFEIFSPQLKQEIERKNYKTSTQPKNRSAIHEFSTKNGSRNDKHQTSSTGVKQSHERSFPDSQTLDKNYRSNLQKDQYIYSFKDKHLEARSSDSLEGRNRSEYNINVRPFTSVDRIDQEQQNLQNSKFQEPGLLKIHSRNQDEVPRLSLMSRYNQSKCNLDSFSNLNEISNTKIQNVVSKFQPAQHSHISARLQASQLQPKYLKDIENKAPLRERRQKAQRATKQASHDFQMIVLDPKMTFEEQTGFKNGSYKKNAIQKGEQSSFKYERTQQKIPNPKETFSIQKKDLDFETSPLALRQSPNIVSLETPSTLRRRNQTVSQITSSKKNDIQGNFSNPLDHQNERCLRSSSVIYKPSVNSYDSTRTNSRQNIMKRYQNFVK